jgi:hypothetical protein
MRKEFKYLVFNSEDKAKDASRAKLLAVQDPAAQADPATVTKYLYGWTVNEQTGKTSLIIEVDDIQDLAQDERDRLKDLAEVAREEEVSSRWEKDNPDKVNGG